MKYDIILYSVNCAKCKVLETKLDQLQISYSLVTDPEIVARVGKAHGITSAPILQVDDIFYDFTRAIKYLKEIG